MCSAVSPSHPTQTAVLHHIHHKQDTDTDKPQTAVFHTPSQTAVFHHIQRKLPFPITSTQTAVFHHIQHKRPFLITPNANGRFSSHPTQTAVFQHTQHKRPFPTHPHKRPFPITPPQTAVFQLIHHKRPFSITSNANTNQIINLYRYNLRHMLLLKCG